ncbi:MAG: asparagine synthase C-terminal domain-containing protein [Firmicutes bacterium]|nr:asparagine synthase C-terminal domain-containing protein [Bacillota bacterium]
MTKSGIYPYFSYNLNCPNYTLSDRKDRMSMYNGLEVRVPFCDHRIAEYMYSVPWKFKEMGGMEKGLLREAAAGLLPDAVRLRKKSPYPKTHDPGYRDVVSAMLSDIIEDTDAPIYDLISRDALQALIGDEFSEPWYGQLMTGPQTMAYMIQLNYWLERYDVRISL